MDARQRTEDLHLLTNLTTANFDAPLSAVAMFVCAGLVVRALYDIADAIREGQVKTATPGRAGYIG